MDKEKGVGWKWRQHELKILRLSHHPDSATCRQIYDATAHRTKYRFPSALYKTLHDLAPISLSNFISFVFHSLPSLFCPSTNPPLLPHCLLYPRLQNIRQLIIFQTQCSFWPQCLCTFLLLAVSLHPSTLRTPFEHQIGIRHREQEPIVPALMSLRESSLSLSLSTSTW